MENNYIILNKEILSIKEINDFLNKHKKNFKYNIVEDKSLSNKECKYISMFFETFVFSCQDEAKSFLEELKSFFQINEKLNINYVTISTRNNDYVINFGLNSRIVSENVYCFSVNDFDVLNKENMKKNLIDYLSFKKLDTPTNLKFFKDIYFSKINQKDFNSIIEELESENFLKIERTPKLLIKKIEIKNTSDVSSHNYDLFLNLKSSGKLKDITPTHQNYKNSQKSSNMEHTYNLELYKLHLMNHLKTFIILDNDKWYLEINYFVLKYAKDIMQDIKGGTWSIFKNNLNETVKEKLSLIEDYLNLKIENKDEIFPLKYTNGINGETIFKSNEIKFK